MPIEEFPVGLQRFVRNRFVNYQINRWRSLGFLRDTDIADAVSGSMRTFRDCATQFAGVADVAAAAGRVRSAFGCWRTAEFFEPPASPQKFAYFERAVETFDDAFSADGITRHEVPFGDAKLSALRVGPLGGATARNETVLVCGGFDSLIEEFYGIWGAFALAGYDVIAYEGPGQGATLRRHGLTFDHDWEKPTAAVLDHFGIERAALMGISMGGYWAVRAAAFEPRITRVIAHPPVYDWLWSTNAAMRAMVRGMMKARWFTSLMVRMKMATIATIRHMIAQANFICGGRKPMDAIDWILGMNHEHLHSECVTCDVLLLGGERDAFQPPKLLRAQKAALTNARSVAERIFTRAEHGDQHCQIGNVKLAPDEVVRWLDATPETPA